LAAPPGGVNTSYTTTHTYDALNRLTGTGFGSVANAATPAAASSVTFGHSYNKANQRVGQAATDNTWIDYPAATPGTTSYTANALNQYTAVGGVAQTYSTNGNLTSDGANSYGYDAENRLTSANTATYTFDAQGRRKSRTSGGATTIFVTAADNREVLEYDGSTGALLRWYAYGLGPNAVLGQMNIPANTRTTPVPDLLGTIVGSMDAGTGTLTKFAYRPYGASAAPASPFGFTGQRVDPEAGGIYYYRARAYSSAFGRFIQPDPIGYDGGTNFYAYVFNDPLNLTDSGGQHPDPSTIYSYATAEQQSSERTFWSFLAPPVAVATTTMTAPIWGVLGLAAALVAIPSTSTSSMDQPFQYVVRGGEGSAHTFQMGTRFTQNGYGFSVQTAPNTLVEELARGGAFPNRSISVTRIEQLQAIPGVTINFPTPGHGSYHGTVNVPHPPPPGIFESISGVFTQQPNPYPIPRTR
jgi:RHS repeat-associated protein